MPSPGASGTSIFPSTIRSGSFVNRCPSCHIQCVSIAVVLPGAAAATCVYIASEISKWLFECDPQVNPHSLQNCATRTEPCIVQKCGSANGISTAFNCTACFNSRQSVAIMLVAVGRDRKSTRLNSSHLGISYAVFCLKK